MCWCVPSGSSRDKCGKLALSPKQKAVFSRWVRPDDICHNPTMIMSVSSFSIKQVGQTSTVRPVHTCSMLSDALLLFLSSPDGCV